MNKLILVGTFVLAAVFCPAQSLIEGLSEVHSGQERPIKSDTFDSRKNLRVRWNSELLRTRLAEEGQSASVASELKVAAELSVLAKEGLAAVEKARAQMLEAGTDQVDSQVAGLLKPPLDRALKLSGYTLRINQAVSRGVARVRPGDIPVLSVLNSVFQEVELIGTEVKAMALNKGSQTSVNFWIGATVSRDFDPTRRRNVPFLSELTQQDRENLAAVKEFADKYAGTPSAFLKNTIADLRKRVEELIIQLETLAKAEATSAQKEIDDLVKALRDIVDESKPSIVTLKQAVNDLKTELDNVASSLRTSLSGLGSVTESRTDALATLGSFDSALSGHLRLFEASSLLKTKWEAVQLAVGAVKTDAGNKGKEAVEAFEKFVSDLKTHIETSAAKIETTLKGSVKSLVSSMGLAEDMRVIANFVEKGDLEKGYQDINFMGDGGKRFDLNAGDKVTIGIKISKAADPPADFEESRDLYAYPSGATSDRLFPIVFAQRDDLDSSGNRRRGWRFSPTYMDAIKFYRPGASQATNKWFTPGFGIAISALDQNGDDAYELGLGAGITLLDDRLVGGVGFNLQRNRMYAFFGIRLRLGDLGIKG